MRPFPPSGTGNDRSVLERSPDTKGGAVRLTFPVTGADADLNAMVLAGAAEGLRLKPTQAAGLGRAVATESAGAMLRHAPREAGRMSVEVDFEEESRRLKVTAAEETTTESTCADSMIPDWSESSRVEPPGDLVAEFFGSTFVRSILPRVLARAALSAHSTLEAVTRSTVLGDLLADAVLDLGSDPNLEIRVQTESDSLRIRIQSSSDRVLSALAAVWPGEAEMGKSGKRTELVLSQPIPAG